MPTIDALVKNSALLSDVSMKYLTPPNFTPPLPNAHVDKSILAGEPFNTMDSFLKDDLFGAEPTLSKLIDNYTENKDNFKLALKENLDSLKDSSDRLQDLKDAKEAEREENATGVFEELAIEDEDNDENTGSALSTLNGFANGEIPPEPKNLANIPIAGEDENKNSPPPEEDEDTVKPTMTLKDFAEKYLTPEAVEQKISEISHNTNETSRADEVKDLVRSFNSVLTNLNENRGVSNLMSALADKFGNSVKMNESKLNEIGISVTSEGFLALNESIFNSALEKDEDDVNSILGNEGLAGRLEKDINLANSQSDRLFTSVLDYLSQRNQDDAESLYGNNANYAKENMPRFVAMWT